MGTPVLDGLHRRLLSVIADKEDTSPRDLPPLGDTIDVEALRRFLGSSTERAKGEFRYLGWRITIRNDGQITMSETTNDESWYVARCNTCDEEKRGIGLDTAQDFFAHHVDRGHAVEMNRIGEIEPQPGTDADGSGAPQENGID